MNKKGVNFTIIAGLIFGIIMVFVLMKAGILFTKSLIPPEDQSSVGSSMDGLKQDIEELKINDLKINLFYSLGEKYYLMAFNKNNIISECYGSPCIAICDDPVCTNLVDFRIIDRDINFIKTGKIVSLDIIKDNYIELKLKNTPNGFVLNTIDCSNLNGCDDYTREINCKSDPCSFGGYSMAAFGIAAIYECKWTGNKCYTHTITNPRP